MKLIDTHAHLYLDAFDKDREQVVRNAIERGLNRCIFQTSTVNRYQECLS